MFYELIYTRCRNGIDILKNGQVISSDGFKVYSCSPQIFENDMVDLPFLENAAKTKQSYTDPGFMDEAYLYYAPDKGNSFLLNFYPVTFDRNAKGDFAKRPGNFINHVLIGDFSEFYPFELFGNEDIWSAKSKEEAYYYETEPTSLASRKISDPFGKYTNDKILKFINEGREEALKKAVAFIIEQYSRPPENRKYLLIKDDTSEKIELWTAAIQAAFSPRAAAAIPFATRMDKFANSNKYTVNASGMFQAQMNVQDSNQKLRFRAMIVGVDERDKANANAARPLANSPFVLLDGKNKKAMFEADASSPYFQLVTKFDEEHQQFCRVFLQSFDISLPNGDILEMYDAFTIFSRTSLPPANSLATTLKTLDKHKGLNTKKFREMYKKVESELSRFLQEDLMAAFGIIKWLKEAAKIVEDAEAGHRLTDIVCKTFLDLLYRKSDSQSADAFWSQVKQSEFAKNAARAVCDPGTIRQYSSEIDHFKPQNALMLLKIYLESSELLGTFDQQNTMKLAALNLEISFRYDDKANVGKIISLLSRNKGVNVRDFLFSIARNSKDAEFVEFLVGYMIDGDNSAIASDSAMVDFCRSLDAEKMGHLAPVVIGKRLEILNSAQDLERFIATVAGLNFIRGNEMADIFLRIDKKITSFGRGQSSLAQIVQKSRPRGVSCPNSAHIYALDVLSGKAGGQDIADNFESLHKQGVPSKENQDYVDSFAEALLSAKLDIKGTKYFVNVLETAPLYYYQAYAKILSANAAKFPDKWNVLIAFADTKKDENIENILVQILADSKLSEKNLFALESLLKGGHADYFKDLAKMAREVAQQQKAQSKSKGLFGRRKK